MRRLARFRFPLWALPILLAGCRKPVPPSVRHESLTLSERAYEITVPFADGDNLALASQTLRSVAARNRELLNAADPRSEMSRLNLIGGGRSFPVSEQTHRILVVCKRLSERTQGMFDITLAPLLELWGFEGGVVPREPVPERVLQAALQGVGSKQLDVEPSVARLNSAQTRVGLGDALISYTLDLTVIELRQRGVENLLLETGSLARSQGRRGSAEDWSRTIEHPFVVGSTLGSYRLDGGFGAARVHRKDRFVTIAGRDYPAVIDPRTGNPAEGTAAVHVLAPSCTDALALAQALFVVGVEGAPAMLSEFPRAHVLMVPDSEPLALWLTEGFEERLQLTEAANVVLHRLSADGASDGL